MAGPDNTLDVPRATEAAVSTVASTVPASTRPLAIATTDNNDRGRNLGATQEFCATDAEYRRLPITA